MLQPHRGTAGHEERLSLTLPSSKALLPGGYPQCQLHGAGSTGGNCWEPHSTGFGIHLLSHYEMMSYRNAERARVKMEPQQRATADVSDSTVWVLPAWAWRTCWSALLSWLRSTCQPRMFHLSFSGGEEETVFSAGNRRNQMDRTGENSSSSEPHSSFPCKSPHKTKSPQKAGVCSGPIRQHSPPRTAHRASEH